MSRSLLELDEFLVGHWDFENDFKDKSGNDNDGVPTNVEWKPTAMGMKPRIENNDVVVVSHSPSLNLTVENFTLSAWVNLCKFTDDNRYVMHKGAGGGTKGFRFGVNVGGGIYVLLGDQDNFLQQITPPNTVNVVTWTQIVASFDRENGLLGIYANGSLVNSYDISSVDGSIENTDSLIFGYASGSVNPNYYNGGSRIYSTALSADEVLAIYNSTKDGHGVLSYERSYTHRLSPDIDDSTVFASDFSTKNADGTLVDLSGHSNHGTINGAVRAGGYFSDGMRFDGKDDYVTMPSDATVSNASEYSIEVLISGMIQADRRFITESLAGNNDTIIGFGSNEFASNASGRVFFRSGAGVVILDSSTTYPWFDEKIHHITISSFGGTLSIYTDGVLDFSSDVDTSGFVLDTSTIGALIRTAASSFVDASIIYVAKSTTALTVSAIESRFNSLARLPIYSCEFRSMPSNTTVYTDALPYSSAVINSGSFKLDDGLTCVTDGQLTLRCAHALDGSEYVYTRDDDGKFLSGGTGGFTDGTIVTSIEQGSTIITINMTAGDTLNDIHINFREEVGCPPLV